MDNTKLLHVHDTNLLRQMVVFCWSMIALLLWILFYIIQIMRSYRCRSEVEGVPN